MIDQASYKYRCSIQLLCFIMVLSFFIAGCGPVFPDSDKYHLYVILPQKPEENPFWQRVNQGVIKAGRELDIELSLESVSDYDVNLAVDEIENAIKVNPDGIVLAPGHGYDELVPVVQKAIEAGIPVITFDSPLNSEKVLSQLHFDNVEGGRKIGEWIAKKLDGQGKIIILHGGEDSVGGMERVQGFLDGIEGTDVEMLDSGNGDWNRDNGKALVTEFLDQYADIDAILAVNDAMALGAADAVS